MRILLVAAIVLFAASYAVAATKSVTCYLDGTRVESSLSAPKGYLELPLPGNYIPGSFRVRPVGQCSVTRVEMSPASPDPRADREVKDLVERRRSLEDRLKALEVRQEIFTSAAKSQSSKAPRKTKTNPHPLETIRKGTDYAVAQLEEVYRGRRKAEEGLRAIEARIVALKKEGGIGGSVARVWLSGKGGAVYSYLTNGAGWTPVYDFRLGGKGMVEVTVKAQLPRATRDKTSVVLSRMADTKPGFAPVPITGNLATVARYNMPVEREEALPAPQGGVKFTFRNTTGETLAAGAGACYMKGEYVGHVSFAGSSSGDAGEIAAGSLGI